MHPSTAPSIAIIGSFRKHYREVLACIQTFRNAGMEVTSPAGSGVVSGNEFVRFATDPEELPDEHIQSDTLERIFRADAVYVAIPDGYVGRTTCYEIGRVVQRRQPIYFMERPADLPVHIPGWCLARPADFVLRFVKRRERFAWLYFEGNGGLFDAERRLAASD